MKFEIERGNKGQFEYSALSKYFPTRFKVDAEYQSVRDYIFSFKNGQSGSLVGKKLASMLANTRFIPRNEWWLCIIPASTQTKTRNRFFNFCVEFANATGVNNGYDLIFDTIDREEVHMKENRSSVNILDSLGFRQIEGKKIILFDDVYTTGRSFFKVATKLKALGALQVHGIFLGKTTWPDR